ncbi:MAG TPA: hypothetical protein VMI06_01025 [Terriglobia bacterium]|nr:hypothetical protein [Terriglobia bacterium]
MSKRSKRPGIISTAIPTFPFSSSRDKSGVVFVAVPDKLLEGNAVKSRWVRYRTFNISVPDNRPVSKTVDLSNTGTYRGEQPSPLQSVVLPSAPVRLTIVLPRFSSLGQYLVAVTHDQSGNGVVAEGIASANSNEGREKVSVELDLRSAKAGAYFLSTTHEQDQAAYYYPLQIR